MATTSPAGDRIFSLDAIRGIAVMGIFSVNIVGFAMIEAAYFNPGAYGGHSGADLAMWASNLLLIDGKMRTLFSMLFGASTLLVIDRAAATGQSPASVHYRRMLVLLLIGLIHYYLIWFGDILVLYALSGMIVFFVRRKSVKTLIIIGCVLMLVHMGLFGAFVYSQAMADLAAHAPGATVQAIRSWNEGLGNFYPSAAEIEKDRAIHLSGIAAITAAKLEKWTGMLAGNVLTMPETLALMMFGMAGYKCGFLTGEWDDRRYRLLAAILVPVGLIASAGIVWADVTSHFFVITIFAGILVVATPFITVQAIGYASLIILLTRQRGWLSQRIAATGRCAFSNYIGTSLIATFIFYGWGLGYYGSVSRAEAWLLVPFVWLLMLLWSKPWLDRYRYGPLEWLWRSLSRGSLQPMRKAVATA